MEKVLQLAKSHNNILELKIEKIALHDLLAKVIRSSKPNFENKGGNTILC